MNQATTVLTRTALAKVDWLDKLGEIRVPTWIVSGAQDVAAPPELQEILANGIPHARHSILQCGHLPTLEDSEGFLEGLTDFLIHKVGVNTN